jgi:hypothetical protein
MPVRKRRRIICHIMEEEVNTEKKRMLRRSLWMRMKIKGRVIVIG